jgi:hypothetical protein
MFLMIIGLTPFINNFIVKNYGKVFSSERELSPKVKPLSLKHKEIYRVISIIFLTFRVDERHIRLFRAIIDRFIVLNSKSGVKFTIKY